MGYRDVYSGQPIGKVDTVVSASSKELDTIHYDYTVFTALAANLTVTFDTNPYILPGLKHILIIKDDGTRRTLNISASTINGIPLPTSTTASAMKLDFQYLNVGGSLGWYCVNFKDSEVFPFACSDELTALVNGTGIVTGHWPYNFIAESILVGLGVTSSSGNVIVDFNKSDGNTVFATRPTIGAGDLRSTDFATPPVLSTNVFAFGDRWTLDIDSAGTGAKGLKLYWKGFKF